MWQSGLVHAKLLNRTRHGSPRLSVTPRGDSCHVGHGERSAASVPAEALREPAWLDSLLPSPIP